MDKARVAVITGGLSGIGLGIAQALADQGVRVAIGARRGNEPEMQARMRAALGPGGHVGALDVRDGASVAGFLGAAEAALGPVDILVNSAGIAIHQTLADHDLDDWQAVIDTNLTGPFRMTRACLPGMIARGWGRIINIASTAAHTARPSYGAYCASKAGLLGLTRATALEGAPHGVVCVSISPSWVETEMLRNSAAEEAQAKGRDIQDVIADIARANAQARLIQPSEIGALAGLICSDDAPSLAMSDIQITGGADW